MNPIIERDATAAIPMETTDSQPIAFASGLEGFDRIVAISWATSNVGNEDGVGGAVAVKPSIAVSCVPMGLSESVQLPGKGANAMTAKPAATASAIAASDAEVAALRCPINHTRIAAGINATVI
jgi:hypothetical protein